MGRGGLCCVAIALFLALIGSAAGAGPGTDGWDEVHVRVLTFHYRTHDGFRRAAYVVLPDWYRPGRNPSIPLVISPHGRGVSALENLNRWGNLAELGPFAVVNPEGQGRRLARFSWGYRGQVDDLARMPALVQRSFSWVRIDPSRIYAFGASMGGQETLLLVARHPSLLAGAVAFDPVTDMRRRYREFARLRCNRRCLQGWRSSLGSGLRSLARLEVGGTPRQAPRAYRSRSPLALARTIARSGVPLQLWWSMSDKVVPAGSQSVPLAHALRRLHPVAPVDVFTGSWPHAADMHPYYMLIPALRKFGLIASRTPAAVRAGRTTGLPLHPLLPWHRAVRDSRGRVLAWYRPGAGLGYDHVLRLGWRFIERRVPRDPRTGSKIYLNYAVFDGDSLRGIYWQHNPAFVNAAFVDSLVAWYPYSGDRRAVGAVRQMLDYQLRHGTTPAGWAWPHVPFSTSCAGERSYGRCLAGLARRFYGGIEPDKVGLLGLGYLRFYELTGARRYLTAAVRAGNALAHRVRAGDAAHTPWPFRVDARTGRVLQGAEFGGVVVGPVRLLDELIKVGAGQTALYRRARDLAWSWVVNHQLNPASSAFNRWSGFYEDVPYYTGSRNQMAPTLTAHYILDRELPEAVDPDWREHVEKLLRWVRSSFGRGPFAGAWAIDEQWRPGTSGCCSRVGLGSTTSRWAAMNALLSAQTGDGRARELATRSLNYATYFARSDGRISCCGQRSTNTYWFSDGYADYLRSFNWGMAALPELAPKKQDHLLGSTSVVQAVTYRRRRLSYRTFDMDSVETLRLSYVPRRIIAGGEVLRADVGPTEAGYTVEPAAEGDVILRIRHDRARRIRIEG